MKTVMDGSLQTQAKRVHAHPDVLMFLLLVLDALWDLKLIPYVLLFLLLVLDALWDIRLVQKKAPEGRALPV